MITCSCLVIVLLWLLTNLNQVFLKVYARYWSGTYVTYRFLFRCLVLSMWYILCLWRCFSSSEFTWWLRTRNSLRSSTHQTTHPRRYLFSYYVAMGKTFRARPCVLQYHMCGQPSPPSLSSVSRATIRTCFTYEYTHCMRRRIKLKLPLR